MSLVGMWMQRIAIGWLTWELAKSGLWLEIVAFADFFPVLLIGPIAGAAADRWDRLRVVKICQTISLVQATVLFALTASRSYQHRAARRLDRLPGRHRRIQPARPPRARSVAGGGDGTSRSAVAINSVVFNRPASSGPMFAGLAIVWSGVAATFAANA